MRAADGRQAMCWVTRTDSLSDDWQVKIGPDAESVTVFEAGSRSECEAWAERQGYMFFRAAF